MTTNNQNANPSGNPANRGWKHLSKTSAYHLLGNAFYFPPFNTTSSGMPAPDTQPLSSCIKCQTAYPLLERALSLVTRMATGYDWTPDEVDLLQEEIAHALSVHADDTSAGASAE